MIKAKPVSIALILMLILLGGANYSYAVPVQGVVDPGSNWVSTLTGTATYTFTNLVGGGGAPMNGLSLGFSGSVFDLGLTAIDALSISPNWSVMTTAVGTYEFALLGGTPIPEGASLSFSANYGLLGSALTNGGNIWEQYFGVIYAGSPYFSGGVTSVRTPESGSFILLGLAMVGLVFWKRRQESIRNG